jgi:3',5'-cyclic-AMP phosphodiesterase
MRIIQITDIHVNKVGELTNDISTQLNFLNVLSACLEYKPDMIVLTGDLCHDQPSIDIYQWFLSRLAPLGIPFYVIAGNHDNSSLIADVFGYKMVDDECFFEIEFDENKILFLDSHKGSFSETQFSWLESRCDENSILFTHYPPVFAGIPHMDGKYSFLQIPEFKNRIRNKVFTFSGHCHNERTIMEDNLNVFITPSCFIQIDDKSEIFKPDHFRPAFRIIDYVQGRVNSTVKYC